jgi:hypothetical protein
LKKSVFCKSPLQSPGKAVHTYTTTHMNKTVIVNKITQPIYIHRMIDMGPMW